MKARLEDKKMAIELRKKGLSYKEIQEIVPVSKSLLSGWFEYLELTTEEESFLKSRIKDRRDKGRISSTISNRNRRIQREVVAFEDAKKLFDLYRGNNMFLLGVSLYWAEGSKRTGEFQFINSDPEMILFMYMWIQKFMNTDAGIIKKRLFTHKIPGFDNLELFWSHILSIKPDSFEKTIYKPTEHSIKKNPNYKGCLRLSIPGIYNLRLIKAWQKLLIQYYCNTASFNMHP
jgi:hypothetical protein